MAESLRSDTTPPLHADTVTPSGGTSQRSSRHGSVKLSRRELILSAIVALVVLQVITWYVLRSQGWNITGDTPGYLDAARALAHLTLNPGVQSARAWPGPHGPVFAQGLGLPLVLAPFSLVGGDTLATLGFFTIIACGFVFLHQRASRLIQLGWRGQLLLGLSMGATAVFLASTQVYPDLISGVFLACGLIELARVERMKLASPLSVAVIAIAVVAVPWFQIKNALPAFLITLSLVILSIRTASLRRSAIVVVTAFGVSLVVLLVYNDYFFGHLLGLPQPNPALHYPEIEHLIGLVFDRHFGFLIQVPTIIFGLVGLWISRRAQPLSNISVVLGAAIILVINGTQPGLYPLGGSAMAGRFEWTVVPMLLVWSAFLFKRLETSIRTVRVLTVIVAGLWIVQGSLILADRHVYLNAVAAPPWDPSLYPGWWGWLNHYLPSFLQPGWGLDLLAAVLVFGAAAIVLIWLAEPQRPRQGRGLIGGIAVGLVVIAVAVSIPGSSPELPTKPYALTQADLGGWATAEGSTSNPPIAILPIGPGAYRLAVTYQMSPATAVPSKIVLLVHPPEPPLVSGWLSLHLTSTVTETYEQFSAAQQQRVGTIRLIQSPSAKLGSTAFTVSTAQILSLQLIKAGATNLRVKSVSLIKTGNP
jgi:hypothetical protein